MLITKFFTLVSSLGFVLMLSTNCASRTVYVVKTPPAAKVKVIKSSAPYHSAIWVKGYWSWHSGRYVWVDGYWIKPRRGHVWVQGHWVKKPQGWVWVPGHWNRAR